MKLNLTATNKQEELILAYLEENASETLANKINNGTPFEKDGKPLINKKTLTGFMKYACDEARKLVEKGANSACVDDTTVYGWAIHYFEEESIEGTLYTIDGEEYKPAPVQKKTTQKSANKPVIKEQPKQQLQFSLFDSLDVPENKTKEITSIVDNSTDESDDFTDEEKEEVFAAIHEEETQPTLSPVYLKYKAIQEDYPDYIVAYRLGDFYEVFGDNAVTISNELDLTLTGRDVGLSKRIPMIGFPYHVADNYLNKIAKFHKVIAYDSPDEITYYPPLENEDFDLTESEMKAFDGDIEEKHWINETTYVDNDGAVHEIHDNDLQKELDFAKAFDKTALCAIDEILGNIIDLR